MNLVVSMRSTTACQFGVDGAALVESALRDRVAANNNPAVVAYLDDREDMAVFGLDAIASTTAGAIMNGVRAIRNAAPAIESVFIIGGHSIVPHHELANPLRDRAIDPDDVVLSDNPYGAEVDTLRAYLVPGIPVGRLCHSATDGGDAFARLIAGIGVSGTRRAGSMSVVNEAWVDASTRVIQTLAGPVEQRQAPGYQINDATKRDTSHRYLYFNLHGFHDDSAWKAFDRVRGQFTSVATPSSFDAEFVAGSIVFAENCYGALTVGKSDTTSCALRLMREGCVGFVGATGLAFGSLIQPNMFLDNADLLAMTFFESLMGGVMSTGTALVEARRQFLAAVPTAAENAFCQKTLLQFTLLGDPTSS